MVFFRIEDNIEAKRIVDTLQEKGVKINGPFQGIWRLVTNHDVSVEAVQVFIDEFKKVLENLK